MATPPPTQSDLTQPKTPNKPTKTVTQATPYNHGSASRSDAVVEGTVYTQVDNVKAGIAYDVRAHSICSLDNMLHTLLVRALPHDKRTSAPDDLLAKCLTAVLPIANGKQKKRRRLEESAQALDMLKNLQSYCSSTPERESYVPLVTALNDALECLASLDLSSLSFESHALNEDATLFHIHDSKRVTNAYGSWRLPDLTEVSVATACRASQESHLPVSWDRAKELAIKIPHRGFSWRDILSCWELKVGPNNTGPNKVVIQLPSHYTLKAPQRIAAQPFPEEWFAKTINAPAEEKTTKEQVKPSSSSLKNDRPSTSLQAHAPTENEQAVTQTSLQSSKEDALRASPSVESRETRSGTRASDIAARSQASGSNSNKRKASGRSGGSASKRSRTSDRETSRPEGPRPPPKTLPAMIQSALYATERLSASCDIMHAINVVIVADIAYIWWYDRQGAIQTEGLNFVEDLPRFLVLLLALQRFDDAAWGVNPVFQRKGGIVSGLKIPNGDGSEVQVDLQSSHPHYGMAGRATTVLRAWSLDHRPGMPEESLKGIDMVAKVSWPEQYRLSEGFILQKVEKIAEDCEAVAGHVPKLFHAFDVPGCATDVIRRELSITEPDKRCRVLRILLLLELSPITDLSGKDFQKAISDCFICHYCLWKKDVRHRDISVGNLMFYMSGDEVMGVLNDFDQASCGEKDMHNTDRTGTLPFMAIDLLTPKGWKGQVLHRYRHDAESFVWVAVWVAQLYHDKQRVKVAPLGMDRWADIPYGTCREKKTDYATNRLGESRPTVSHLGFWKAIRSALGRLGEERAKINFATEEDPYVELSNAVWSAKIGELIAVNWGSFWNEHRLRVCCRDPPVAA